MKLGIQIVLWIASIFFAYKIYDSINGPIKFNQTKNEVEKISDQPDSILFVKAEEKLLLDKINEIRVNFISASKDENYDNFTQVLSDTKATIDTFFENVVVNDEDINIKKNRLKLLQMFCNTYDNFINFSKIEGL